MVYEKRREEEVDTLFILDTCRVEQVETQRTLDSSITEWVDFVYFEHLQG